MAIVLLGTQLQPGSAAHLTKLRSAGRRNRAILGRELLPRAPARPKSDSLIERRVLGRRRGDRRGVGWLARDPRCSATRWQLTVANKLLLSGKGFAGPS